MKVGKSWLSWIVFYCLMGIAPMVDGQDIIQSQVKQPNGVVRYSRPILWPNTALGDHLVFNLYNGWNSAHVHKTGWALFSKDDRQRY